MGTAYRRRVASAMAIASVRSAQRGGALTPVLQGSCHSRCARSPLSARLSRARRHTAKPYLSGGPQETVYDSKETNSASHELLPLERRVHSCKVLNSTPLTLTRGTPTPDTAALTVHRTRSRRRSRRMRAQCAQWRSDGILLSSARRTRSVHDSISKTRHKRNC